MSLRRQLLVTLALQGAGSASVLLATIALGVGLGPEVQGVFSHTKAQLEFIAALAMLGLPQSLFYYVKSRRMSRRDALRWSLWSAGLALPVGTLFGLMQGGNAGLWLSALFGLTVALLVAHGQLRVLLLVRERVEWFNVLTALPQVLLLVGVGCAIAWGSARAMPNSSTWLLLFALAYGLAATLARWWLGVPAHVQAEVPVSWREVCRFGLSTWLTAVLATSAVLAVQRWVEGREGPVALGQFTLAMTLVQVPLTPVTYAAPLLFRRWMEKSGALASRRWAGRWFGLLIGLSVLVWLARPTWPDLGLGPTYVGTTAALAVLLAGGAAEAASRLLAVQASAIGRPWVGVRAEAARWVVLALAWLLPLPEGLLTLCATWAAAAWISALVFVLHVRVNTATPVGVP